MKNAVSFLVGVIFALGLGASGMTQVQVVKGFLDIFGEWNPALIGVMAGAIGVHSVSYYLISKKGSPLLDTEFHVPSRKDIDKRLIIGAAIFGLGWGWVGICPGPGIVSLMSGQTNIILFVLAMLMGMIVFKIFKKKFLK